MTLEAGTPMALIAAGVSLPDDAPANGVSPMGGGSAGVALTSRLVLEADALVGVNFMTESTADLWGGVRWHTGDPFGERGTLSLLLGGGSVWSNGGHPVVGGGAGLDLPAPGPVTARTAVTWLASPAGEGQWLVASVGVAFTRRPAPPPVASGGVSPPPGAHLTVANPPEGTRVWLPHPVCDWVPLAEIEDALVTTTPPISAVVEAAGYLPAHVTLVDGENPVALVPAPAQGALFLATTPGDQVRVGAGDVLIGERGTAQLAVPAGAQQVWVAGGGRETHLSVEVPSGWALWMRVPTPRPWSVLFPQGSAVVSEAQREALRVRLAQRGGYHLAVQGSASPEGDVRANLALAEARAKATFDVLRELGASPEIVDLLPPTIGVGTRPPEEERAALVLLRPPASGAP